MATILTEHTKAARAGWQADRRIVSRTPDRRIVSRTPAEQAPTAAALARLAADYARDDAYQQRELEIVEAIHERQAALAPLAAECSQLRADLAETGEAARLAKDLIRSPARAEKYTMKQRNLAAGCDLRTRREKRLQFHKASNAANVIKHQIRELEAASLEQRRAFFMARL